MDWHGRSKDSSDSCSTKDSSAWYDVLVRRVVVGAVGA